VLLRDSGTASDVVWLILNNLMEFWQMSVEVCHPLTLLLHDVLSCASVSYLPFVYELTNVSYFCGNRWDTELTKSPVILITTDSDTHGFFRGSCHLALREWGLFGNLSENWQNTRSSLIDVISLSTVERIYKCITVRMSINNEIKFFLMSGQEVFKCDSLWLRCSFRTRIVQEIRIRSLSKTLFLSQISTSPVVTSVIHW